jgi:hypothetical protein
VWKAGLPNTVPVVQSPSCPRHAVLRWLGPLVVGAALATAVGAAGFSVESTTLPRPSRAQLVGTRALDWLIHERLVKTVEKINGRRLQGVCMESWFRTLGRPGRRFGALLVRSDGVRALVVAGRVLRLPGTASARAGSLPSAFEIAACPRSLANRLSVGVQDRRHLALSRTRFAGKSAFRLSFSIPDGRIILFVRRNGGVPLAEHLVDEQLNAWGYLRLMRLTPAQEASLSRYVALASWKPYERSQ